MIRNCALFAALFFCVAASAQSVVINELMASNDATIADATGEYEDWIELYNPTGSTINLSGYYVTDKVSQPTKYQLPSGLSVAPGGYLILWASDEPSRGSTHLSFKLSAGGEYVALYLPDGTTLVDETTFGPQRTDVAWGRQPNGTGGYSFLIPASPGAANGAATAYQGLLEDPDFSQAAGFYTAGFNLTLSNSEPGASIFYTLDGSEPDPADVGGKTFQYKNSYEQVPGQSSGPLLNSPYETLPYSGPINISDRSSQPNRLSIHASAYNQNPTYLPGFPVFKGTVVRARVVKSGFLASNVSSRTFVVTPSGSGRFTLPVVGIAVPPKQLFDYQNGIYTAGITFDNWRAVNNVTKAYGAGGYPGNFMLTGDEWEARANVEFFDNANQKVVINQPIDLRIHGGYTRGNPRKASGCTAIPILTGPFFPINPMSSTKD